MNAIVKGLAHLFVSTAAVAGTVHITSGDPITSGNVLIPASVAGTLAVVHAIFPSIVNPPSATSTAPPPTTPNYPSSH